MTTEQLVKLFEASKVKNVSFDGSEFEIEFENGISVTVGTTTEWDAGVFEIESSIEKYQKQIEWEERNAAEKERKRLLQEKHDEILSKFPVEQWDEIKKTFKL